MIRIVCDFVMLCFWLVDVVLFGVVGLLVMFVLLASLACVGVLCVFGFLGAMLFRGLGGARVGCGLLWLCGLLVGLMVVADVVFPGLG